MSIIKLIIVILQIAFTIQLSAQFTPKINGVSSFARFLRSETFFVLSGNAAIDSAMVNRTKEFWTITPIHFISEDSFALITKDRDKSFVYIKKLKNQGTNKLMKTLCLVNGGYDQKATYINNTLAYISMDNEGYEANEEDIVFRLGHVILQLQDVVLINKEENIVEKKPEIVLNKYIKQYNKRCAILREKTLLVDVRYLSLKIISKSEFEKLYKYPLEFVKKDVIEKAILDKDPSKAYLISSLNLVKINTITDCESGQIVYAEFEEENKVTNEFNRNFDSDDMILLNGHVKAGK